MKLTLMTSMTISARFNSLPGDHGCWRWSGEGTRAVLSGYFALSINVKRKLFSIWLEEGGDDYILYITRFIDFLICLPKSQARYVAVTMVKKM